MAGWVCACRCETAWLSDATRLYYLSVVHKLYDLMMDVTIHFKLLLL